MVEHGLQSDWAVFRDMWIGLISGKRLTLAKRGRNGRFKNKWWCISVDLNENFLRHYGRLESSSVPAMLLWQRLLPARGWNPGERRVRFARPSCNRSNADTARRNRRWVATIDLQIRCFVLNFVSANSGKRSFSWFSSFIRSVHFFILLSPVLDCRLF